MLEFFGGEVTVQQSVDAQVLAVGMAYRDLVMTGLRAMPCLGEESYATGLYETWGGVATMARVCRRLGLDTALCTAVGDDEASDRLLRDMAEADIDTTLTARHHGWRLPVTISLSLPSDRAMVTVEHPPPAAIAAHLNHCRLRADAIVIDMRDPAMDWLRDARARGARVYASRGFDPTGQWSRDGLDPAEICDVLMLNELEARAYTGLDDSIAAARALTAHVPLVIVTRGPQGMVGVDAGQGEEASVPAFAANPKNTTGAGDSALAAFVYASRFPDQTLTERLDLAAFIAGAIVDRPCGAADPPSPTDLLQRVGDRPDRRLSNIQRLIASRIED